MILNNSGQRLCVYSGSSGNRCINKSISQILELEIYLDDKSSKYAVVFETGKSNDIDAETMIKLWLSILNSINVIKYTTFNNDMVSAPSVNTIDQSVIDDIIRQIKNDDPPSDEYYFSYTSTHNLIEYEFYFFIPRINEADLFNIMGFEVRVVRSDNYYFDIVEICTTPKIQPRILKYDDSNYELLPKDSVTGTPDNPLVKSGDRYTISQPHIRPLQ